MKGMTTFARTISRVNRLIDALLAQTFATGQWPVINGHLNILVTALQAHDRGKADEMCLLLERQYCSSPYLLRTFETDTSWNARVPAPGLTLDLAAQARAADFREP